MAMARNLQWAAFKTRRIYARGIDAESWYFDINCDLLTAVPSLVLDRQTGKYYGAYSPR
jgi:hypothetical protein